MEISISQLAAETGLSISHICQLVKRGQLPQGRKDGKTTYLPAMEARIMIEGRRATGPRSKSVQLDKPNVDWSDVL